MSSSSDDIRVRIAGDLADINKSLAELKRNTQAAGKQASASQRQWQQLGRGLDSIRRQVAGVVGAYLGFRAISGTLRAVVRNTVEAEAVAAQLEARVRSTGGVAGFTTEQLLGMAAGLQKVTAFGDETIANMQGILLTFTQVRGEAFEKGTEAILNMATALGTDLNSAALQVGKALNDPILGVTALTRSGIQFNSQQRALIKSLVETGDIAGAQRIILAELETQFGGAARAARNTLGGALEAVKNAFGDLLEGKGGNVADAQAALIELTTTLEDPATIAAFGTITGAIISMTGKLAELAVGFTHLGQGLGIFLAQAVTGIEDPDDQLGVLNQHLKETEDRLRLISRTTFKASLGSVSQQRANEAEIKRLERRLELLKESKRLQEEGIDTGFAPATAAAGVVGGGDRGVVPVDSRPAIKQLQADLAAAGVLLTDELKRLGAGLDRDFKNNLVRFRDYYRERAELETRAVDQQLAAQRASLALIDEEIRQATVRGDAIEEAEGKRAKLVAEITVLERQRRDVALDAAIEQAEAEQALAAQLEQVRRRLLELQGSSVEARTAELEAEYRELLARLKVEGDTQGEALVRGLINVELARSRLAEIEDEYARMLAGVAREEQRIQVLIDSGTISEREGRGRIIELHQQAAREVAALLPLMRELAEATGDPAAIERLKDMELQLEQLAAVADRTAMQIRDGLRDAGEGAFSSFISGAQNASSAWDRFIGNIRQKAADLVSEKIFDQLFAAFSAAGGGGGGTYAAIGSFFAGLFHGGGIAGQAQRFRRVPKLAFANAPRYHNGGLAPGEVPAVLRRGEEVLTRGDPRHRGNARGGDVTVNIAAQDVQSFRRQSPGQMGADIAFELLRARNRNA